MSPWTMCTIKNYLTLKGLRQWRDSPLLMSGGVGRGRQWWSCRPRSTRTTRTRRVTRTMSVPKEPEGYHVSKRTVGDCAGVLMSWDHWEEHLIVHVDTARVKSQVPVHTHSHSRPPTAIKTPDKQTIQKVQNNTQKKVLCFSQPSVSVQICYSWQQKSSVWIHFSIAN